MCKAEARIDSVINSDAGKSIKVKGLVTSDGLPVIEIVSLFLYRGRFDDFQKKLLLLSSTGPINIPVGAW